MSDVILLHGTDHIIKTPSFGIGNEKNDYGKGFYCTEEPEMAREWACKRNKDGFANRYALDTTGLKTLSLLDGRHSVLNWIALLLQYRTFHLGTQLAVDARDYIIDHFSVELSDYDVIVGYRADDSYFSYAESFVQNALPLRSLNKALRLGRLGAQTVLKSEKAFSQISFLDAEPVDRLVYYPKFRDRDSDARIAYRQEIKNRKSYLDDLFVLDIIRGELSNDDPRIQRILLE